MNRSLKSHRWRNQKEWKKKWNGIEKERIEKEKKRKEGRCLKQRSVKSR